MDPPHGGCTAAELKVPAESGRSARGGDTSDGDAPPQPDERGPMSLLLGAVVDLNHPGKYIHWGFFQMSLANFLVIVAMVVVFILAVALPFPKGKRS